MLREHRMKAAKPSMPLLLRSSSVWCMHVLSRKTTCPQRSQPGIHRARSCQWKMDSRKASVATHMPPTPTLYSVPESPISDRAGATSTADAANAPIPNTVDNANAGPRLKQPASALNFFALGVDQLWLTNTSRWLTDVDISYVAELPSLFLKIAPLPFSIFMLLMPLSNEGSLKEMASRMSVSRETCDNPDQVLVRVKIERANPWIPGLSPASPREAVRLLLCGPSPIQTACPARKLKTGQSAKLLQRGCSRTDSERLPPFGGGPPRLSQKA
mmetsp:Transcript_42870/g.128097  ORF Transcript_42870/g.128097 Transcript_42870/m.128097 type:complete len:272 (+) Transcript_42870:1166-1981(+)